ncbi:MAG: hypothetical protein ACRDVE_02605 [Actinocrinis sp.]
MALIDFDAALPGPRIWDVAYAACRFDPLTIAPEERVIPVAEQARRLRVFADAYDVASTDRAALVEFAIARLDALVDHMTTRAASGDEAFAGHLAAGRDVHYGADAQRPARPLCRRPNVSGPCVRLKRTTGAGSA